MLVVLLVSIYLILGLLFYIYLAYTKSGDVELKEEVKNTPMAMVLATVLWPSYLIALFLFIIARKVRK